MLRATLATVLLASLICGLAEARKPEEPIRTTASYKNVGPMDGSLFPDPRFAIAAPNTTLLAAFTFESGGACNPQGWTVVDATAQIGSFWHVEDFAGANVNPGDSLEVLAGSKSLWCGTRPATLGLTCGYLALPGYGDNWDQVWQTKACIAVVGDLDVSFTMETDSEADYDATYLEYTTDCTPPFTEWTVIDGGLYVWDGAHDATTHATSYPGLPTSIKVRLRFNSDESWSDQDGQFDSHAGPVVIDDLVVEGLSLEDFEDEAVGDDEADDWEADVVPGYGASYMALFPGATQLQEDGCVKNVSCLWAATFGSPETYECGGFPQQAAVPKGNSEGQYLNAEIRSPVIPLAGTGNVVNLQFSVYRDLKFDNLVFYTWAVRPVAPSGCAGNWRDRNFFYASPAGTQKDWHVDTFAMDDLLDFTQPSMQVRIGVVDMCKFFCGSSGSGECHSHAPLLDNVRVYRVDLFGPRFAVRDVDQFQDTFPTDGTDSGTGRADAAVSWQSAQSVTNIPADSATLICRDGVTAYPGGDPVTGDRSGLAVDPVLGGWQIYCWVRVIDSGVPQVAGPKFGAGLQELPRYPFKDTQVADGKTWTRIRCDRANNSASRWRIDFPDALFQAGDIIEFFYGATSTAAHTSYCSGSALTYVQSDVDVAAAAASEFTILPLGSFGDNILYVDGMDGRGAEAYWESAFQHFPVVEQYFERYDVRAPTSGAGNRPGGRVTNVVNQLNANYQAILWDCGDITPTLGDGTGDPEKSDDYDLINTFLANLSSPGGVYIGGDDFPQSLDAATGASANIFKSTYITYNLTSGNAQPSYGIAPIGTGMPVGDGGQGAFAGDTWVIYGGCPTLNDFDVMEPTGSSVLQSTYGPSTGNNGAEISQTTGNAGVVLGGYSIMSIRDDEEDGVMDRAFHLRGIWRSMGIGPINLTGTDPVALNRLEQNYPNPFNPTTTIAFSIKQRARVKIDVYNVAGERVRTLLDEKRAAGSYTDVRWDGTDAAGSPVASGVYFYKLVTTDFAQTRKMVLLK